MRLSNFILLISIIFFHSGFSGAWTQKKNGYYFKIAGSYFLTRNEYNFQGEIQKIREDLGIYEDASYQDLSLLLYLEYGLTEWYTVIIDLPYKNLTSERTINFYTERKERINTSGLGDLRFANRFALLQRSAVISIQPGIKIPLGYETNPTIDAPSLGTGEIDGELLFQSGFSFWPKPWYMTGGFGYRWRGGPAHNEYLYIAEMGYATKKLGFKLSLDGVKNTQTPPDIYGQTVITPLPGGGGTLPSSALADDEDYLKVIPEFFFKLSQHWSMQVGLIQVVTGKNVESGTTYMLGLTKIR
jgi:hypothetical protein